MIGSFLTRGMTLMLGYLYPAYECFKCIEKNRPELDSLRFWCEYWIIIAVVTVLERAGGDALISWLPLYGEAKLAFIVYLWYPKTRGTDYVYATFVRPFVARYEQEIDGNLGEFRTRAGELFYIYWQRFSTIFQARFVDVLQFLASQSPGRVPYASPPSQNAYPPRGQAPRLQSAAVGGAHQPSAPPPPPGYPAPPPGGYPDLSGYQAPSSGTYPAPPPGYPSVLSRSGPATGSSPQPPPPPPGYPGPLRSRSSIEEDDEFELVDNNTNFPDEQSGPNGYMTRARQRALGDRGRGGSGSGAPNPYVTRTGGNNGDNKSSS